MQSACCEEVMMTEIHELAVMRWTHAVGLVSMLALLQCNTPEESILGTFVLDEEAGCELCPEKLPDDASDDEPPGDLGATHSISDGGQHTGQYELVPESAALVLNRDGDSGAFWVDWVMQTEYEGTAKGATVLCLETRMRRPMKPFIPSHRIYCDASNPTPFSHPRPAG